MKKQNRLLSLILSLFLLLFTLVPQSALTVKAEGNSEMAVHFIDVGQGNAILVQSGGQNLLYDGGDQSHADLIISYLQEQNVENIDYMIASHYDEDHMCDFLRSILLLLPALRRSQISLCYLS